MGALVGVFILGLILAACGDEDAKEWIGEQNEKGGCLYFILLPIVILGVMMFLLFVGL